MNEMEPCDMSSFRDLVLCSLPGERLDRPVSPSFSPARPHVASPSGFMHARLRLRSVRYSEIYVRTWPDGPPSVTDYSGLALTRLSRTSSESLSRAIGGKLGHLLRCVRLESGSAHGHGRLRAGLVV